MNIFVGAFAILERTLVRS